MNNRQPLPHDPLPDGASTFLMTARWNIEDHLISNDGAFPPAMFAMFSELSAWAESKDLTIRSLEEHSLDNACLVVNEEYGEERYEAVWVRVGYSRYRDAMEAHIRRCFIPCGTIGPNGMERHDPLPEHVARMDAALKHIHGDHVINVARLKTHHSDGWVMLLPVIKESNSGYGSKIERRLGAIDKHVMRVDVDELILFKLYGGAKPPQDRESVDKVISMLNGSILNFPHKQRILESAKKRYLEMVPLANESRYPSDGL